ncbi:16S rRNA (cytidine(1402)-2'-O)-methyltransferase [Alkalibacter rhizosphaerae]|uniref:Ribosomal RNA small subunit methyltransferase I n=1 Tax=Alkalibacter rhizosphaerae TaxID=2815577 RepID=A0A974XD11_9FIRM|nr:16S rRNA (cytidine(1402)-2'-O)-methyltransferase [Alkalibacter rhizosphaerae]QSX07559.1 16S rRNA (cytidine(1402)-2'-O)-methyltransferase [Alkalibacter rhizosphaerae]
MDTDQSSLGTLYLVATPIGNLEDMSFRAVRTLKEVSLIAAEDTRHTRKLLQHYEITTPMVSYHQHNEKLRSEELVKALTEGKSIGLVSDAGTPGISDPGEELVRRCLEEDIPVTIVPGANAAVSALVISGLSARSFCFLGFLSPNKTERQEQLDQLRSMKGTAILYEAPHRLQKTLKVLLEELGDITVSLVRELTKIHETVWRGNISRAIMEMENQRPRGEYVVLLQLENDKNAETFWQDWTLEQHMDHYLSQGQTKKEAVKTIAKDRGVPKREIYDIFMK